jgi:hypothetical protein
MIAAPGRAPLVATSVAMALAASWKPLVNANAKMATTASTNAASTARHPPSPRLARILAHRQPAQLAVVSNRRSRSRR